MLGPTHLVFGQACYLVACISTGHTATQEEALVAAAASWIPDIDSRQSYVGRMVWPLAEWLEYRFGHRTITHSLTLQAAVGFVLYLYLPFGWFLALIAGWMSHSLADMMTPSGVAWFWPARVRVVLPGNPDYRWEAMSSGELATAIVVLLLSFPLVHWATQGEGATGLVRQALGRIDSALELYESEKGETSWTLEIKGRDNLTQEDVSGTYQVISNWADQGFIIDTDHGEVTACQSAGCDWYTSRAIIHKGQPQTTTTITLTTTHTTGTAVAKHLQPLAEVAEVFLVGTFTARRAVEHLPLVGVSGETVRLRYARPEAMRQFKTIRDVSITVQIRHKPGAMLPNIGDLSATQERSTRLAKWMH